MKMKRYPVHFERDDEGQWVVRLRGVPGVLTQATSLDQGRRRIREALALAIGDDAAATAELVEQVRLPAVFRKMLSALASARRAEARARADSRRLAAQAVPVLKKGGLSAQDLAQFTGFPVVRIQQFSQAEG
jgi:predicted RNase H-like HicB family nuclease